MNPTLNEQIGYLINENVKLNRRRKKTPKGLESYEDLLKSIEQSRINAQMEERTVQDIDIILVWYNPFW